MLAIPAQSPRQSFTAGLASRYRLAFTSWLVWSATGPSPPARS